MKIFRALIFKVAKKEAKKGLIGSLRDSKKDSKKDSQKDSQNDAKRIPKRIQKRMQKGFQKGFPKKGAYEILEEEPSFVFLSFLRRASQDQVEGFQKGISSEPREP